MATMQNCGPTGYKNRMTEPKQLAKRTGKTKVIEAGVDLL
jgi:hypothetical protein